MVSMSTIADSKAEYRCLSTLWAAATEEDRLALLLLGDPTRSVFPTFTFLHFDGRRESLTLGLSDDPTL